MRTVSPLVESLHAAKYRPAIAPPAGSCLRAELATKKQAAKIEREALPSTWTEEKAIQRHDQLMKIAKPLQKVGPDKAWRMRYEPIKNKTWMRTRHQVVIRKKPTMRRGLGHSSFQSTQIATPSLRGVCLLPLMTASATKSLVRELERGEY